MPQPSFLTTINCIDGRVHPPVTQWMHQQFDVDYIDRITVAGPDRVLTTASDAELAVIRRHLEISITVHGSHVLTVVGHYDCAGNPVSREEHLAQIQAAAERVHSWALPIRIFGLWVNEAFEIEVVCELPAPPARP